MELKENTLNYTLQSLESMTTQSLNLIMEMLIRDGIATKNDKDKDRKIYIGNMSIKNALKHCINYEKEAIKRIEEWEIAKTYRYSMLFKIRNFDETVFHRLVEKNQAFWYTALKANEEVYQIIQKPSIIREDSNYILKFNCKLTAYDSLENHVKQRYTVLVFFYISENIIEIRFDGIAGIFNQDKFKIAQEVLEWLRSYMKIEIFAIDLYPIVDYIKKNKIGDEIVLAGQDMLMATGGKATVDIGNDDSGILPFIGELKAIMEQNLKDLDKVPELKSVLDDFIFEKENLSEFPWVKLKFCKMNMQVKFIFNYGKENGCLLQHLYSPLKLNQRRERMDYVTNYIMDVRNMLTSLPHERG